MLPRIHKYKLNGLMVRMVRIQLKMSVGELARRTGLTKRTVQHIEHNRSPNPRLHTIGALSEVLGVDIHQLILKIPKI